MRKKISVYVPEGMKYCHRCGQIKTMEEFGNSKYSKDGKRSWCKECNNQYTKELTIKKKMEKNEVNFSRKITKGMVDDIFDVKNLKDIPTNVKKKLHIPEKVLSLTDKNKHNFEIKSNITNVLRRLGDKQVHISQLVVAYYRMFNVFINTRSMSKFLSSIKKNDKNLSNPCRGYYKYNNPDLNDNGGL